MSFEAVGYDVEATGVATITLDHPDDRNALSDQLLSELIEAFTLARDATTVRCVVLTSSHEKVFSAGGDLAAEISVMGAEGAVEIIFRKQVEAAEDPGAKKAALIAEFRKIIDVYVAAANAMIDDVIDPRETRPTICRALEMAEGKTVERPWKRSAVVPV